MGGFWIHLDLNGITRLGAHLASIGDSGDLGQLGLFPE